MRSELQLPKEGTAFPYLPSAGAPVLALYFALSFVFSDFGISAVWGALLLCLYALACAVQFVYLGVWREKKWDAVDGLLLLFFMVVLANALRAPGLTRATIYYCLILGASFTVFWTNNGVSNKSIISAKRIVVACGLFVALLNIGNLLFPSFVESLLYPVMSETSVAYNERLIALGYGFSIGENVGYSSSSMALAIGLLCIGTTKHNWKNSTILLFLLAVGLFAIQRRGELLVCCIAVIILSVIRSMHNSRLNGEGGSLAGKDLVAIFLSQVVCVSLAFVLISSLSGESRLAETFELLFNHGNTEQVESEAHSSDDSLGNGRGILWSLAWSGFIEKPLFGHGWGGFAVIAPQSGNIHATNAHNIYLQLLCEVGIVGFVLTGITFGGLLLLALKEIRKTIEPTLFLNKLIGLLFLLFLLGDGLVDNSIFYPYVILIVTVGYLLLFRIKENLNEDTPKSTGLGCEGVDTVDIG